jgi:hypothetical protein
VFLADFSNTIAANARGGLPPDHEQLSPCSRGTTLIIDRWHLLAFDQERVTFRWKDYAHGGKQGQMTLAATEFLRRFFLHVLPKGFVRIRHFGFLAKRFRAYRLALCRHLLAAGDSTKQEVRTHRVRSKSSSLWHCPRCGTSMVVIQRFTAAELSTCMYFDSS